MLTAIQSLKKRMIKMIRLINNFFKMLFLRWLFTYDYDIHLMEGGKSPIRIYKRDAGYDLYVSKSVKIPPRGKIQVPTGVAMRSKIPAWILLTNRSSTLARHGIIIDNGIIDGDYIGELFISAYNSTGETVHIPPDTRIAQIIVLPHTSIKFNMTDYFSRKRDARNENGFGSSGK